MKYLVSVLAVITITACTLMVESGGEIMNPDVDTIFEVAKNASSSHNLQPWLFKKSGDYEYKLISVKERWLTEVDPDNRELLLSLGAIIENIHQAAGALGFSLDYDLVMESREDIEVATFKFEQVSDNILMETINVIKSVFNEKKNYIKGKNIDSEVEELKRIFPTGLHYIKRDEKEFTLIKKWSIEANNKQAWRDNVQRELAKCFIFDKKDKEKGIGLTPEMIRLPGIMLPIWYGFYNENSIMDKSFRDGTAPKVKSQIDNSSGFLILTSPGDSVEDLINCGREYQRLLIESRRLNVEIHPISQILEEEPYKENINSELGIDEEIQFILRVGKIKHQKIDYEYDVISSASIRMPLKDLIKE